MVAVGRRGRLRRFLWYMVSAGLVATGVAAVASGLSGVFGPLWALVGVAYGVQLAAFLVLVLVGGRDRLFMGWVVGTVIRFAALLGVGVWVFVTRTEHAALLLLTFVGVLFVLALLEPMFIRQRREMR